MLMSAGGSALLIIDVQEKLVPAMHAPEPVVENCAVLMRAAAALDVPILVSEQYPKGLGATVSRLAELAPAESVCAKVHFSCAADAGYLGRLEGLDRRQAVLGGIESHVCVLQTALDLAGRGYECAVVADAVTSRRPDSKAAALDRLRENRVEVVTTEMVLFEWMHKAGTPAFKEVSALIK